jgi:hypothetical protein
MTLPDLDPEAFWALVDRSAGAGQCWLWTGPANCDGYGLVFVRGRVERAHRVAWLLAGYDLSEQITLDHVCVTYRCCNPWHLTPLSRAMHARRGRERGRFDVLRPAPILDEHARRVAAHLHHHGPTELVVLADTLEIPVRTLRKQHMADRVQARYGIRRHRHRGRVVFHPPAADRTVAA